MYEQYVIKLYYRDTKQMPNLYHSQVHFAKILAKCTFRSSKEKLITKDQSMDQLLYLSCLLRDIQTAFKFSL